jgi:hypothetical protein
VELVALVRWDGVVLASAEGSEVLSSLGDVVFEQLKDDTAFLELGITFFANGNVKVGLGVLRVELGQLFNFLVLLDGHDFLLVQATTEQVLHVSSLLLVVLGESFFAQFPMVSQRLVLEVDLDGSLDITACISPLASLVESLRSEEERLHCLRIDS